MSIKLIIPFLFICFLSCADSSEKEYYPNGNLKREIWISNDDNVGNFKEYYETGELMEEGTMSNGVIHKSIFFKNGKVKETGSLENGLKTGWWTYNSNSGESTYKEEYKTINEQSHLNQKIYLNTNDEIDLDKSSVFTIDIPDTLKLGKNIGRISDYNSGNSSALTLISVVIKNEYESNIIKSDTFSDGSLQPSFGIYAYKKGLMQLEGTIIEQELHETPIGKDSTSLLISQYKRYFEKEVFVKDSSEK